MLITISWLEIIYRLRPGWWFPQSSVNVLLSRRTLLLSFIVRENAALNPLFYASYMRLIADFISLSILVSD